MAAAERLQNIMAKVTCPICLELFRDPVAAECGHSFCRECIARHCQGNGDVACPLCNFKKGNLRPNWELRNIVELLRSQPVEEPRGGNMCERHQEPLKLYCTEHQTPICLVCRESQAHRGHTMVPVEEAVQEYWETMKKQLEGIESTYGRLHPLVSLDRKHLSPSAGEEAQGRLKGLTENLATLWKVDTEGPRQRFEAPASQPQPREPDGRGHGRGVATRSELRECQGREPGSEPAAEKQEETRSHVVHVCEEAPTPKYGLDQTSLDPTVHSINSRRDFEKSEVDVKGLRSRFDSPTSPAPTQVSAGDQAGVSPAGQGAAQTESGGDTGGGSRGPGKQKAAAGVHTETSPAPLPLNSPTTEYQQADAPSRGDSPQIAAGAPLELAGSGQVGVSAVPVGRAAPGRRGPGGKALEKTKICVREVAEPPGSGARNSPQGPRDASAGGVDTQQTENRPKDGPSLTPAEGSGGSRTDASSVSSEEEAGKGAPAGGQAQPAQLDPPKQPLPWPLPPLSVPLQMPLSSLAPPRPLPALRSLPDPPLPLQLPDQPSPLSASRPWLVPLPPLLPEPPLPPRAADLPSRLSAVWSRLGLMPRPPGPPPPLPHSFHSPLPRAADLPSRLSALRSRLEPMPRPPGPPPPLPDPVTPLSMPLPHQPSPPPPVKTQLPLPPPPPHQTELEGHSERAPGSETEDETKKTGSHLHPVGEEAPGPKPELSQGSQDSAIHKISGAGGKSKPKVDAKKTRKRTLTRAEESGGSKTDATPASSEQEDGTMVAAADSVKRIKEQATCPICLELFRDPVTTKCGHSFCRECIAQIFKGHEVASCPHCRRRLRERDLRSNRDLKNIAEILRSQAAGKPEEWKLCKRHRQPLQLYCKEDQRPICLVCMLSKAHRGHTVVPLEEALQEYREKIAEQLGVIDSSCGKLHQFVKQVWEHLPENEREEEHHKLARVSEKLTTVLQEHTETPGQRFGEPPSQPPASPSPARDVSEETELEGHSGREPGSEPAAETQEETRTHVVHVCEEAPTPKEGLDQASLDQLIHTISNTTEAAQCMESIRQHLEGIKSDCEKLNACVSTDQMHLPENAREAARQSVKRLTDNIATLLKVAVQQTRKRPLTPAEGPGGSSSDGSSANREQEGAAMGGRNEAAGEEQQHPAKKRKDNEN